MNKTHINKVQKEKIRNVKKIPDASGLVTTTVFNQKTSEVENKILDTSSLLTITVFNTRFSEVENKIFDHAKYTTTQEFNKLTAERFAARLKQAKLVSKTDFDNRLINFNGKITSNNTKCLEVVKILNSLTRNDSFFLRQNLFYK